MATIKVNVTQSHIDNGMEGISSKCAIALSLKDMGFSFIEVDDKTAGFSDKDNTYFTCRMPEDAAKFVIAFDSDKASVSPFSFSLDLDN